MRKKKHIVIRFVDHVVGHQAFSIMATSEEEAIRLVKNGEGEFELEELEVQNYQDRCEVYIEDENES